MSTTYNVVKGDTFVSIARKEYGDDTKAFLISNANPGVLEPLSAGIVLSVPSVPGAPVDKPQGAPSTEVNEVAVLIENERFRFWEGSKITRSIDAVDTIELSAPFEADAPGFRETFRPLSYKSLNVIVGGEPLFTGTIVGIDPVLTDQRKTLSISGYSLPGVLGDCTPPSSSFPLEFQGQNLSQIAKTLLGPFGLSVVFEADPGPAFERVAIEPGKKVLEFLITLAKQRNLIVSSTERGELLFQQSILSGTSVAQLVQGVPPFVSAAPSFQPQEYYNSITGIGPAFVGIPGSQFTVSNPRLSGIIRPITFAAQDAEGGNLKTAVDAKSARMFANVVSYSVPLPTWRDPAGQLWAPNTLVSLEAPDAMVYSSYQFLIRSIEFERPNDKELATLRLVIPGAFSGVLPEVMPWD